jgi:hypothetical protein
MTSEAKRVPQNPRSQDRRSSLMIFSRMKLNNIGNFARKKGENGLPGLDMFSGGKYRKINRDKYSVTSSDRENKKYKVTGPKLKNPLHFGQAGVRASPGSERGDRYCTRSYGITDKNGKPTRNDPKSANYWSRKHIWNCKGKKSLK